MATCVNQCAKYVSINERFIFIRGGAGTPALIYSVRETTPLKTDVI